MRSYAAELFRFAVVGSIGFAVDALILTALTRVFGVDPLIARVPSFLAAVICTWLLHRTWTFQANRSHRSPLGEFFTFLSTQIIGIGINFTVFSFLVVAIPFFHAFPVAALAVASVAAMGANFTLARHFVFSSPAGPMRARAAAENLRIDKALFAFVSFTLGFFGLWAVLSQSGSLIGLHFAALRPFFFIALAGAAGWAFLASKQDAYVGFFPPQSASPPRWDVLRFVVGGIILASSFAIAYFTKSSILFFVPALALAAYGCVRASRGKIVEGARRESQVANYTRFEIALLLGLAVLVLATPLFLHRPNADDGNFVNLAAGMIGDPRPLMAFDTMIGDPNQRIHLGTYRVETYHALIAMVSDLTGVRTITSAHMLLPPAFALSVFAILTFFARMTSGKAWLIALLITLATICAFGDETRSFGNFSILRLQQGKALLFSGFVPLIYVFVLRFWHGGKPFDIASLALVCAGSSSISANGIHLAPITVFVVATALLLYEPHRVRTYVVTGLSATWPVLLGLVMILSGNVDPSEVTESVPVFREITKVFGGRQYFFLTLPILAGWALLTGPSQRFFAGTVAVFVFLTMNPLLSPLFADYVTGNLNWRLFYAWPLPLFAGLMAGGLAERLNLTDHRAISVALVFLIAIIFSPLSIFSEKNGLHFKAFGLDVPGEVFAAVEAFDPLIDRTGVTLAPEEFATWLATVDQPPPLVAVRQLYLTHYRHSRSEEDVEARSELLTAVTNSVDDQEIRASMIGDLDRFDVTNLVLRDDHPRFELLERLAREQGFSLVRTHADYRLYRR